MFCKCIYIFSSIYIWLIKYTTRSQEYLKWQREERCFTCIMYKIKAQQVDSYTTVSSISGFRL